MPASTAAGSGRTARWTGRRCSSAPGRCASRHRLGSRHAGRHEAGPRRPRPDREGVRRPRRVPRPARRGPRTRRGSRLRPPRPRRGRPARHRCRRPRHASQQRPELVGRLRRGRDQPGGRRRPDRAGVHRRALLRVRLPRRRRARCSPPATTRRSTTGSSCAGPVRHRSGRRPASAQIKRAARGRRPGVRRSAPGTVTDRDLLAATTPTSCSSLVDLSGIRRLKVVVDAGNGMGGHTVPVVLAGLPLDGRPAVLRARRHLPEPRGEPDRPGEPARPAGSGARARRRPRARLRRRRRPLLRRRRARRDRHAVHAHRADRGARARARARARRSSTTSSPRGRSPRSCASTAAPRSAPGSATRSSRQVMAETGAVFGGEHSGHFYFRDFWRADSGMLAALHVLAALGETPEGTTLSSLLAAVRPLRRRPARSTRPSPTRPGGRAPSRRPSRPSRA